MQIARINVSKKEVPATFAKVVIESLARKSECDKKLRERRERTRAGTEKSKDPVHAYLTRGRVVNFYIKKHNSLFSVSSTFNRATHACMTGSMSARSVPLRASVSPVTGRKRRGLVSGASLL